MNLGTLLSKAAITHSNGSAIRYGDSILTYSELNDRVNSLANSFLDLGVKKGETVAIMQRNCPQLIETLFACFKTGIVAVPLNVKLHPREFAYIIDNSRASAMVFGDGFKEVLEAISGEIDLSRKHLVCLKGPSKGMVDYEKEIASSPTEEPRSEAGIGDTAWLFYTSGTTGKPKGAMLTHRNLMRMTMNFIADLYSPTKSDVALHAAPLTHGSGLYMLPLLARGATNIILKSRSFDPKLVFETVQREKTSIVPFLTPTMIKMLLISPHIANYNMRSLRCVIYGGSPMYEEDIREAIARFGKIFVQLYGQGEAPMTITYLPSNEHVLEGSPEQTKRIRSAGIARTDVEVKVFDESDHELPPNSLGEIVVRGEVVMEGYWSDPRATADTLRNGWLHTGDVGHMDEKGYLFIMDRKKDMIISGGSNIYPREVEEIILEHSAVQEVAVIGVPDPVWGESVKAIIVLKPKAKTTEEEIIEFCKKRMASYKKPKSVEFVETIPKSAYGKTLKREIRQKYWRDMERKI